MKAGGRREEGCNKKWSPPLQSWLTGYLWRVETKVPSSHRERERDLCPLPGLPWSSLSPHSPAGQSVVWEPASRQHSHQPASQHDNTGQDGRWAVTERSSYQDISSTSLWSLSLTMRQLYITTLTVFLASLIDGGGEFINFSLVFIINYQELISLKLPANHQPVTIHQVLHWNLNPSCHGCSFKPCW